MGKVTLQGAVQAPHLLCELQKHSPVDASLLESNDVVGELDALNEGCDIIY